MKFFTQAFDESLKNIANSSSMSSKPLVSFHL